MPTARSAFAAVALNGRLYSIGGSSSSDTLSTVEEYDAAANAWTTREPLSSDRARLAAVVVGGHILAIGGYGHLGHGAVEEYDPSTDLWMTRSPMVASMLHSGPASAFVVSGLVRVLGIGDYNPALDQWSSQDLASSPFALPADVIDGRVIGVLQARAVEIRPPTRLYVHRKN